MMPKILLVTGFSLMLVGFTGVHAQELSKSHKRVHFMTEQIDNTTNVSNGIPGHPVSPRYTAGDSFLNNHFELTTFIFSNNKSSTAYYSKYDIITNEFYLLTNQEIRVLSGDEIKRFSCVDSLTKNRKDYVNAENFKDQNGMPWSGFFEILVDGPLPLVKWTDASIQEQKGNAILTNDFDNHRIQKKDQLLYVSDGIANTMPSAKKLYIIFGDSAEEAKKYIKSNKLDLTNERHLVGLFSYCNSIL